MDIIYIVTGIYFVISLVWYINKWKTPWFGLYPFGVTFYIFTPLIRKIGELFSPFWKFLGYISYKIFNLFFVMTGFLIGYRILLAYSFVPSVEEINDVFNFALPVDIIDFGDINFIIVALFAFVIHEFFHGFTSIAYGINVENTGLFFIPNFIVAAYVKPDYNNWFIQNLKDDELRKKLIEEYNLSPIEVYQSLDLEKDNYFYDLTIGEDTKYIDNFATNQPFLNRNSDHMSLDHFLMSNPISFEDKKIRYPPARMVSMGLFGNLIFLMLCIPLLFLSNQNLYNLAILAIKTNLLFILLNTLPIPLTDGGKVLHSKLIDWFDKERGNNLNAFIIQFFLILILTLIIL